MTYETKVGYTGGSNTTVIPSAVANLLNLVKGDKIVWVVDVSDKGAIVTVTPKRETE